MKVNVFLIYICSVWELVALNRLLLMCPNTDVTTGKIKVVILILIPSSYQWFLNTINRFWSFPPLSGSSLSSSSPLYFHPFLPWASLWFFFLPHILSLSLSLTPLHLFCLSLWSFHVRWSHLVCLKPKEQRQAILDHTTKDPDTSERGGRKREREEDR